MIDDRMGEVRETDDGYELAFERNVAQSVEKVWAAITQPARVSEWLMTRTEIDLRIGGRFALTWEDEGYSMVGQITELDPPRLIAWTWPHKEHPNSVVRWELAAQAGGCRLILTQTHMHPPHMVSVAGGWHAYLECLPGAAATEVTPWRAEREREFFARYQAVLPA